MGGRRDRGGGGRAKAYASDVTQASDVRSMVASVERDFGRVDILVNNAGDLIERRTLPELSEQLLRQVLEVNVVTTLLCCQAAAPGMIARGGG